MTVESLYEVLGIKNDANKAEVKRAYFRKIRVHSNEDHPEHFQLLNRAYQTLYDEKERLRYDRYLQDNRQYAILFKAVVQQINKEDYQTALFQLEKMIIDHPDNLKLKYMLGKCYTELNILSKAKSITTSLIFDEPKSEKYRVLLLNIYMKSADKHNTTIQLKKLLVINPTNIQYYRLLSDVYYKEKQYGDSIRVLEKGWAVNKMTLGSYPLLHDLYFIAYFTGDEGLRQSVFQRMEHLAIITSKKELLLLLTNDIESLSANHGAYPDLVRMIKTINNNQYEEISSWITDRERGSVTGVLERRI